MIYPIHRAKPVPIVPKACPESVEGFNRSAQFKSFTETNTELRNSGIRKCMIAITYAGFSRGVHREVEQAGGTYVLVHSGFA